MGEQTFLVAFDTMDPELNPRAIKDHFDRTSAFTHWWNHLPGVSLVTATIGEHAIAAQLREVADGVRFLVIAARPERSEGWLDETGWRWIRSRERELAHNPSVKPA